MSKGGFSHARLRRMRDVMADHVERGDIPGLITLVSRRGETHVELFGRKAHDASAPIRRDTLFRISSMTKPVTAAAALILVEECKLRLDEPVDRLLPELADRRVLARLDAELDDTVPAQRPITLRDLLTFRMGFGSFGAPFDAYPILRAGRDARLGIGPPQPDTTPPPDEFMRRLGALPLMCQPGERWLYNTSAEVLGVLIARASDRPFDTFLRERVFEPLGLRDTYFSVPATKLDGLATSYFTDPRTGKLAVYDPVTDSQWSRPPAFPSGGAGLVSTLDDYFAFTQMLMSHGSAGKERILSRASVELMTTDQLTPQQKAVSGFQPGYFDGVGWGFCVQVRTHRDELESIGTYGWDGGLGTAWRNDPREQLTTILLSQRGREGPDAPAVCRDLWTSAYQAIDD